MLTRRTLAKSPAADGVPRALPYQAPPSVERQLARLKRRSMLLTALLAAMLIFSVAAVVYVRNTPMPAAPPVTDPRVAAKTPDRPASGPKAIAEFREVPPPRKITLPSTSADGKSREPLLETIGGLSSIHLYQSYLNIGLLADAVESETYTLTEASTIMLTVTELVNLADKQLNKLPSTGLSGEDEAALEAIRLLTGLLRTQSNALLSFWASGDETHAERYQLARERSWTALKEILGIVED